MKDTSMMKKKSGLKYIGKILLATLVLAGLATAGYAAASEEKPELLQSDQMYVFDPFLLSSTPAARTAETSPVAVNSKDIVILAEPIAVRIPSRPLLRSPFRPPLS